jgi:hypothetical protein
VTAQSTTDRCFGVCSRLASRRTHRSRNCSLARSLSATTNRSSRTSRSSARSGKNNGRATPPHTKTGTLAGFSATVLTLNATLGRPLLRDQELPHLGQGRSHRLLRACGGRVDGRSSSRRPRGPQPEGQHRSHRGPDRSVLRPTEGDHVPGGADRAGAWEMLRRPSRTTSPLLSEAGDIGRPFAGGSVRRRAMVRHSPSKESLSTASRLAAVVANVGGPLSQPKIRRAARDTD